MTNPDAPNQRRGAPRSGPGAGSSDPRVGTPRWTSPDDDSTTVYPSSAVDRPTAVFQGQPGGSLPGHPAQRQSPPTASRQGPVAPPYGAWHGGQVPPGYGGGPQGPPPGPPGSPPPYRQGGPSEPPHRRRRRGVLVARIVALTVAAVVLVGSGVVWALTDKLQSNSGTSDAVRNAGDGGVSFREGETVLLVGSDARSDQDGNPLSAQELRQVGTEADGGGINTDTIMLVHIPQGGGKATAVSLPRDTWIGPQVMAKVVGPNPDGSEGPYNPNKINSYYSTAKAYTEQRLVNEGITDKARIERESNEAGRTMLIRVVQAFSGMQVDHYAEVNLLGFYLLSNAIGGVPVCLNAPVNDRWSGANFAAGPQQVQGTAALAFVRQRHGLPQGDLDRVRRQQAFLAGAADKILSVSTLANPARLNDLVGAIDRSVIFDRDLSVISFAEQLTNLSSGNITFQTLPTTGPETSTDTDALATDPAQVKAFFAAISGGTAGAGQGRSGAPSSTVTPSTITVDVQDGTIADGVTARASEIITGAGFTLGSLGVVPGTSSGTEQQTTEVRYGADDLAAAQQVAKAFGVGTLVPDSAVDSRHVLVVVGKDLDLPSGLRGAAGAVQMPAAAQAAPARDAAATATAAQDGVACVN